eukprot:3623069-Pyramimonas_sp.AAC.1
MCEAAGGCQGGRGQAAGGGHALHVQQSLVDGVQLGHVCHGTPKRIRNTNMMHCYFLLEVGRYVGSS